MLAKFSGRETGLHETPGGYSGYPSPLPLSRVQEGLRFVMQVSQPITGQCLTRLVRMQGSVRPPLLKAALQELFKRHDLLRCQVVDTKETAVQVSRTNWLPDLPVLDLTHLHPIAQQAEYRRVCNEESERVLDLAHDPLVRAKVLRLDERTHLFLLCGHRLILDHFSMDILLRELFVQYETLCLGNASCLVTPPLFDDRLIAPRSSPTHASAGIEQDRSYWKHVLDGAPLLLELPSDRLRSLTKGASVGVATHQIPGDVAARLQVLCQRGGANLNAGLIAAFLIFLSRNTGRTDLLLGIRTIGRASGMEKGIGCFEDILPLRGDLSADPCFSEYLRQIRQTLTESMDHQEVSFGELVEAVVPEPPRGHAPLLQFMFSVRHPPPSSWTVGEVSVEELEWPLENSGLDLSIRADVTADAVLLSADYRTDLFERDTVVGLLQKFQILLESILHSPELPVSRHQMLTDVERQQVLVEWNRTRREYPRNSTYTTCFERTASMMPSAIAVSVGGVDISYCELNRSANRLAYHLQNSGVGTETLVGVCLDRSLDLAVALLAILKAGGAFMPLDPAYPKQRLDLMIEDARPLLILTHSAHLEEISTSAVQVICLDAAPFQSLIAGYPSDTAPETSATADSLAYVIYTSGSTGKPNGVEITQRAMVNHSHAVADIYKLTASDRVLQFAALSFDIAIEEIFPSWLQGSTVVFRSEAAISSTQHFFEFLDKERISIVNIPTAFWHQIVDDLGTYALPAGVSRVVVGGEQASLAKWKLWQARLDRAVRFFNAYGPTEATVTSTVLDGDDAGDIGVLSIGRPIANTLVYVLDQHRKPVGAGVPGELYIAGDCLARGYRADPELTAERFVPDPYQAGPGARMYRTGDLARWTRRGTLEFLGRADAQLKIRGYRIEPGEVEAALGRHPAVQSCVVVGEDRADGAKELIAYLVLRSAGQLSVGALRQWLGERLADYMIPSRFIAVASLPLTPAGKIDRRSLAGSQGQELAAGTVHADATNALERELVDLWQRVLRKGRIGIDDNFFDLGGNSLLAAQMFAFLETAWGKRLPLAMLFEAPSIRGIALKLQDQDWRPSWGSLVPLQTQGKGEPIILVHGIKGNVLGFQSLARELGADRPVYGLQAQGLDGIQPAIGTIEEMANLYVRQLTSVVPQGPYHIVGLSFGGLVAYEMAQQLKAMGRTVGLLGVLDAFPNGHDRHLGFRVRLYHLLTSVVLKLRAHWTLHTREGITGLPWILRARWRTSSRWLQRLWHRKSSSKNIIGNGAELNRPITVEMANHLACDNYKVRPYPGKVTLFIASENPPSIKQLLRSAWKPLPVEGVEVHESPGNHNTIIEPPHDRALAMKIRSCLQAFEETQVWMCGALGCLLC